MLCVSVFIFINRVFVCCPALGMFSVRSDAAVELSMDKMKGTRLPVFQTTAVKMIKEHIREVCLYLQSCIVRANSLVSAVACPGVFSGTRGPYSTVHIDLYSLLCQAARRLNVQITECAERVCYHL